MVNKDGALVDKLGEIVDLAEMSKDQTVAHLMKNCE